jgi:hypothetical protein
MFATVKQIFNPKNKDLKKKILFTFLVLFLFKLGTAIIVPGVDINALDTSKLGFLGLINAMGGGAMEKFSILALGVMPYITASIVIQLLQMDIIPYLAELSKQGHTGRAKLNQITRVVGIVLAFFQGYLMSFAFIKNGTVIDYASNTEEKLDILIEDEKIVKISESIESADKIIDCTGLYIMPGMIDIHCHLREPGFEYKETIETGMKSAVKGGFTSICPMPNTNPTCDSAFILQKIQAEA